MVSPIWTSRRVIQPCTTKKRRSTHCSRVLTTLIPKSQLNTRWSPNPLTGWFERHCGSAIDLDSRAGEPTTPASVGCQREASAACRCSASNAEIQVSKVFDVVWITQSNVERLLRVMFVVCVVWILSIWTVVSRLERWPLFRFACCVSKTLYIEINRVSAACCELRCGYTVTTLY